LSQAVGLVVSILKKIGSYWSKSQKFGSVQPTFF